MTQRYSDEVRHLASAPIVIGVDGSAAADAAVMWAAETAVRRGRDLCIVHGMDLPGVERALEPYGLLHPGMLDAMRARGHELVGQAAQKALDAAPGLRVETEVSPAHPTQLLLRHGPTAHLVVLGA